MKSGQPNWTKTELKVYTLLLCANADDMETEEEIALIRSKTNPEIFESLYDEFRGDDEDERFSKIEYAISRLEYSMMELASLKKEIHEVFLIDDKFPMRERYLDKILDNILY